MNKPHIILLCEYGTLSGGERSMLSTFRTIQKSGFNVSVIAEPDGLLADAVRRQDGVRLIEWLEPAASGNVSRLELRRELLAQLLREYQPNLLHANSLSMSRMSGPVVQTLDIRSIGHIRDIINVNKTVMRDINCHDRILCVSDATRTHHVDRGLDPDRTYVQHNGVDLGQFQPREATGGLLRELGIMDPDAILIGAIGQIGLRKGFDTLVDALRITVPKVPNLHCLIIGQRWSDKDESRQFEVNLHLDASEGPAAGHLHFTGYRDDVPSVMNELAMLVHPARQEPLGRVLLEAAASGTPVIATNVGGTSEIFPDPSPNCPESALLIKPDDPEQLSNAITLLATDPTHREQLSIAARNRAIEAFDVRQAATELVEHYRAVLAPKQQN